MAWESDRVPGEWTVEERIGDAASLHASWPGAEARPEVRTAALCRVTGPALVLGSTQSEAIVDRARAAAAGIAVARRRSGGGAVLVTPEDPVWVDVWLPAGDPLWRDDVGRAFDWLGDVWAGALHLSGITGVSAHRQGYLSCTPWSSLVCFGGVGTGEVVTDDGRKVVGLAQRRNRNGAWFHGSCVLRWDPRPLVDVLALARPERDAAVADLGAAVIGAGEMAAPGGPAVDRPVVAAAVIRSLPSEGHR
jgi:lipoate---protein ligase